MSSFLEQVSPELRIASVGRRVVACLLDVTMLAAAILAVHWSAFHLLPGGGRPPWLGSGWRVEAYILTTVSLPVYLYFVLLESGPRQATLGKRWLGLRVCDADGRRIGRGRAFVRTFIKLIPWEVTHATAMLPTPIFDAGPDQVATRAGFMYSTLLVGIWFATVLLTRNSRGMHDIAAETVVVRT